MTTHFTAKNLSENKEKMPIFAKLICARHEKRHLYLHMIRRDKEEKMGQKKVIFCCDVSSSIYRSMSRSSVLVAEYMKLFVPHCFDQLAADRVHHLPTTKLYRAFSTCHDIEK
jgi:hypothetical protein